MVEWHIAPTLSAVCGVYWCWLMFVKVLRCVHCSLERSRRSVWYGSSTTRWWCEWAEGGWRSPASSTTTIRAKVGTASFLLPLWYWTKNSYHHKLYLCCHFPISVVHVCLQSFPITYQPWFSAAPPTTMCFPLLLPNSLPVINLLHSVTLYDSSYSLSPCSFYFINKC